MPRDRATTSPSAGSRAVLILVMSGLLAVTFGLGSTAGAPLAAPAAPPISADSHSDCPGGTEHATFLQPEGGWPDGAATYSDGRFSARMSFTTNDSVDEHNQLDFWDAWPLVETIFITVTDSEGPTTETGETSYEGEPVSSASGLNGPIFDATIVEVEFCYQPLPDAADCPTGTHYFSPLMPALGGWSGDDYTDGTFSAYVYGNFTEVDDDSVNFYDAFPGVATVFVTGGYERAQYPDVDETYAPPGTDSDFYLEGGAPGRVTRIEFCYNDPPPPSDCPAGTAYFSITGPPGGFPVGDFQEPLVYETYSDGPFSVDMAFGPTKGVEFYFDDASHAIHRIYLWSGLYVAEYPGEFDDVAFPTTSSGSEYLYFADYPVHRVEFCTDPPIALPPASDCPAGTVRWVRVEPTNGWENRTYSKAGFSVDLEFFAPAAFIQGDVIPLAVSFTNASRPVRRAFIADASGLPPSEYVYAPAVTEDEFLDGPGFDDITRIELCYVPLAVATPTLPLPTVTPTPTPSPTPTPTPTPTLPPTGTPVPSATVTPTPTPAATATPTTEPTATATPTPTPEPQPSPVAVTWLGSIPPPSQFSADLVSAGFSLLLVLLFLLLALFPAGLFNETIEENYEVIAGWFARGGSRAARLRGLIARFWHGWFGVVLFLLLSGVIYGFLDPAFGFDADSIALFLGIVFGLAITTAAFEYPIVLVQRRVNLERGVVRVLPLTIIIALACVLVSRLAEFQPGYLYGLIAFWAFDRALPRRAAGVAIALTCVLILLMALAAWLLLPGVEAALAGSPLLATFAATTLAVIFIGGLEGLLVELIPIRFLRGAHVWAWRKSVWLVLFLIGGFAFVHILLHPGTSYLFEVRGEAVAVAVAFFVGFGVISVATWAFFRYVYKPAAA